MFGPEALEGTGDCGVRDPCGTPVGLGIDGKPEALVLILVQPAMAGVIEQEVIRLAELG